MTKRIYYEKSLEDEEIINSENLVGDENDYDSSNYEFDSYDKELFDLIDELTKKVNK